MPPSSPEELPRPSTGPTLDTVLLASLYGVEFCIALVALSLHKKAGRPISSFLVAPAGLALVAATTLIAALIVLIGRRYRPGATSFGFYAVIVLNLWSVALMLGVGEVAVRLFSVPTPSGTVFANTLLLPRDWTALAKRGRTILEMAALDSSYLVYDPDLGWTVGANRRSKDPYRKYLSAEAKRALGGDDDIYLSSAEGIRSPRAGMSFAAFHPKRRVALIGDSFTFGLEVHYGDTWGRQLETALGAETQVINFGVDGFGLDQAYRRYQRDVPPWQPNVVILSVINDDLRRTMCVYGFLCFALGEIPFPKPRFVLRGDSLHLLNSRLPDPEAMFAKPSIFELPFVEYDESFTRSEWERHFYDRSALIRYVFSRFPSWTVRGPEANDSALEAVNGALFREFVDLARAKGSIPMVVYLPSKTDFEANSNPRVARRVLAANGIPYQDLTECVRAVPPANRFVVQHYSPTSNLAVARCLTPIVERALRETARPPVLLR